MKKLFRLTLAGAAVVLSASLSWSVSQAAKPAPKKAPAKSGAKLVPINIVLPTPKFLSTPKNVPPGTTVEKPSGKSRPPFLAPAGTTNIALHKTVTLSDASPIIGTPDLVTDGNKEADDGNWVEMATGTQWAQIDLGKPSNIYAIVMWHFHGEPRIFRDVVVKVADDPDFITNVRTLFNNDQDNSSGQGLGKDREYFETAEGKLIDAKGTKARYVRLYSKGYAGEDDANNQITEVEVWGK